MNTEDDPSQVPAAAAQTAPPSNTPSTPRSEWSNRGHKLSGEDNPNVLFRRHLWSPTLMGSIQIAEDNFKVGGWLCSICCLC